MEMSVQRISCNEEIQRPNSKKQAMYENIRAYRREALLSSKFLLFVVRRQILIGKAKKTIKMLNDVKKA